MFKLENATFYYNEQHKILDNVTLEVVAKKVGIIGSNGSGKTTLLKLMSKELTLQQGTLELASRPYRTIYELGYYKCLTLHELLSLADTLDSFEMCHQEVLLQGLGLDRYVDTPIEQLSQGTYKKVGILFAMLSTAECRLFDEPFESIDQESQQFVMQYLADSSHSFVLVDHHVELVRQLCEVVIDLDDLKAGSDVL